MFLYSNGKSAQCYSYQYPSLFPMLILQSLYGPFHLPLSPLFFTCFQQIACKFLQSVGLCTQNTNVLCSPCHSPNCGTESSPQNILTCDLALGQAAVHGLELSFMELCNMQHSGCSAKLCSQAFSGSRAWLRKARSWLGKNACDSCLPLAVSILGFLVDFY